MSGQSSFLLIWNGSELKFYLRAPKPTRIRPADLPPSYNVVMENSDLFQTIATHEKPETPPPSFQSQVDSPPPIENDSRSQMRQTVLTIS